MHQSCISHASVLYCLLHCPLSLAIHDQVKCQCPQMAKDLMCCYIILHIACWMWTLRHTFIVHALFRKTRQKWNATLFAIHDQVKCQCPQLAKDLMCCYIIVHIACWMWTLRHTFIVHALFRKTRRKRNATLFFIEGAVQWLNLVFYVIPNIYLVIKPCYWISHVIFWCGWVRWTCWNTVGS